MTLHITQENLNLILPGKVTALARFYAEDHQCSMLDAIRYVYTTPLYEQMSIEQTKLWTLGAVTLYDQMKQMDGNKTETTDKPQART